MNKIILITASIFGLLAIVLGAFASHGLKELISAESLQTFETGVRYQMYHAIVLLFIGITTYFNKRTKQTLYYLIVIGILFFSGSIYGLATNVMSGFDFRSIGLITPIGGFILIVSWGIMGINFFKMKAD